MKKVLLFVCLCIVLCVPAFAVDFAGSLELNPGSDYYITYHPSNGYYALLGSEAPYSVIFLTTSENVSFSWSGVQPQGSVDGSRDADTLYQGVYYGSGMYSVGASTTTSPSLTPFASYPALVSAFKEALPNLPPPDSGGDTPLVSLSTFNLPRGNVAYFKVDRSSDVSIVSHMSQLSYLVQFGQVYWGPWGDTGQRFGSATSLPDINTSFPLSSQTPIIWTKDSKQTVLGQTKVGHATKACSADTWYVFYNPDVSSLGSPTEDVAGASVDFTGYFSDIKVYPLSMSLNYDSVLGGQYLSSSDDGYASYYDGTPDEDGSVVWTNQDGDVEAPQIGGQNAQYGDLSTDGLIQTVQKYLANIYNEIKSLFSFGYEAIQTLVGIMFDFVNVFQGLYSWLPQPVHSALVSAISVAIVIGVFKVFL